MESLREKIIEYINKGYLDFSFFRRRQISGYTFEIRARKGDDVVELLYDSGKYKCREKSKRELEEEKLERRIDDFFKRNNRTNQ